MSRPLAVAGVQARLSSSRLPAKVLADVEGKPLVERIVERARAAKRIDEVFVLTSIEVSDDPLADELERRGIPFRRGPLEDSMARYLSLLDELDPTYVVRICGDCPLIEPSFVDRQIAALRAFDGDLIYVRPGGVDGTLGGQSVFSARALRMAARSRDPRDREHVGSFFFRQHHDRLRLVELDVGDACRREGMRLSVDEAPDLELVRRIYARFADADVFGLVEVVRWLDENPDVLAINGSIAESANNQEIRRMDRELQVRTVGRWA